MISRIDNNIKEPMGRKKVKKFREHKKARREKKITRKTKQQKVLRQM